MTDRSLCIDGSGTAKLVFGGGANIFWIYTLGDPLWFVDPVQIVNTKIGQYASLAKSCQNQVSYYEELGGDLYYSYKIGSVWNNENVDQTGDVGRWGTSLAFVNLPISITPLPSILYYDQTNAKLKHAYRVGANDWTISVLDDSGPSLSYSTENTSSGPGEILAHGSYYKGGPAFASMSLMYAYLVQTGDSAWAWGTEEVEGGGAGFDNSIAVDASKTPHISYRKWTLFGPDYLKYAKKTGNTWYPEVVESCIDCGRYTSIALDNLGNPAISYYDAYNGELKFAYKRGGTWHIERVDTVGDVGEFTSLAIDSTGRPHISYYDRTNGKVKYAVGILSKDFYLPLILK